MSKRIYTLVCSRCNYVKQVNADSDPSAKSQGGKCPGCAEKGVSWSTWQIK